VLGIMDEYRSVYASKKHNYPHELLCSFCEEWQPAFDYCRVAYPCCTLHERYLVCTVCGTEIEDGEIQAITVDEVLSIKALYEAQKEDIKFYREEETT
jgi:hypothetical protein